MPTLDKVTGGAGVRLAVRTAGPVGTPPVVLPAALPDDPDIAGPALRAFATGMSESARPATSTWFDHVGHLPFAERPALFDTTLADHLNRCFALAGRTA